MPSAVTVGSLAFVIAAGVGLVAMTASASKEGSASAPPVPASAHSTAASPTRTSTTTTLTAPTRATTLTAPTKTTTTPTAPARTTTPTAPARTTTPPAPTRTTTTPVEPTNTTTPVEPTQTQHKREDTKPTQPDAVPSVFVEVYNNSGITGLAAQQAAALQGAGWNVAATDNWYGNIPANTVYYPPQLHEEAVQLAEVLGVPRLIPAVAPMQFDRLTVIFVSA